MLLIIFNRLQLQYILQKFNVEEPWGNKNE